MAPSQLQQQQPPSNPFDGFDAYSNVAAPPPASSGGSVAGSIARSVASAPPTNGMHPSQTHAYQQPPTMHGQQQAVSPTAGQNTWAQQQVNPFAPQINQGALVQSSNQTNPYALNQPPQQFVQPQQQAMMQPQPTMQQNAQQQVVMQQNQMVQQQPFVQQQMVHVGAGNAWAVAPTQMQPPHPAPVQTSQQLVTAPASNDPFGIFEAPAPPPQPMQPVPATPQQYLEKQVQLNFNDNTPGKQSIMPNEEEEEGLALIDVELDEEETTSKKFEGNKEEDSSDRESDKREAKPSRKKDKLADIAPPPPMPPGRENAEFLSRNSGMITSPLPRPSLVLHAGYVLARISFRTVLLRKWKQTFWIQYGPTQLLFFRSYADFGDWLNNPYHSAKAREYLIKLRVDFVSDLKKKSVMGYQVTQIRRKPYGKNVMLHFKLERWMDYGPTIAAAFAARQEEMIESDYYKNNKNQRNDEDGGMNTTNDVSALRKIILGCMRNARDQALLASQERMGSPRQQPEYQGRYAEDETTRRDIRENEGSPEKFHAASQSSKAGLYHQAFAAESSLRRKYQGDNDEMNLNGNGADMSQSETSNEAAKQEAVTQVVDLLG